MRKRTLKPSKAWYWAGIVILLAGVGYGAYSIGRAVGTVLRTGDSESFDLPGQGTIRMDEPGTYPVWVSWPGGKYSDEDGEAPVPVLGVDIRLELHDNDGNSPITVAKPFGELSFTLNEQTMVMLGTFDLAEPATVWVDAEPIAEGPVGRDLSLEGAQVVVTRGNISGWLTAATTGVLVALGSLVIGMLVIVVTAVRRSRDSRRWFEQKGREEPASMKTPEDSAFPPPA
ncbi:MAG: hypothetical protein ACLFV7_13030 [Phycisphaerae bacterium]